LTIRTFFRPLQLQIVLKSVSLFFFKRVEAAQIISISARRLRVANQYAICVDELKKSGVGTYDVSLTVKAGITLENPIKYYVLTEEEEKTFAKIPLISRELKQHYDESRQKNTAQHSSQVPTSSNPSESQNFQFWLAVYNQDSDKVEKLGSEGADVMSSTSNNVLPIHMAAKSGQLQHIYGPPPGTQKYLPDNT